VVAMSEQALPERLPNELTDRDQWVCWRTEDRDGKSTKIPVDPSTGRFASTTDPSTWCSFDRAHEYARDTGEIAGLGFVFTDADPFVGVDLDDCRDPNTGRPTELAKDIVDRLDSYTEVSPSGTGFHVIVRGVLPEGRNRHGDVECYL
jgi:primase-polymerase (primpol)-like protein